MGSVLLDAVSDAVSFYLIVSDIAMSPKTVWSATAVHFYWQNSTVVKIPRANFTPFFQNSQQLIQTIPGHCI